MLSKPLPMVGDPLLGMPSRRTIAAFLRQMELDTTPWVSTHPTRTRALRVAPSAADAAPINGRQAGTCRVSLATTTSVTGAPFVVVTVRARSTWGREQLQGPPSSVPLRPMDPPDATASVNPRLKEITRANILPLPIASP